MTTKQKDAISRSGCNEGNVPSAVRKYRPRKQRLPFDEQVGMAQEVLAHPELYSPSFVAELRSKIANLKPILRRKYGFEGNVNA